MKKVIVDKSLRFELANMMFETTMKYIATFAVNMDEEQSDPEMYANDVAYNMSVLKKFLKTGNLDKLEERIIYQDTLVREFYINELHWIENLREELHTE